jgi:hypothetical protein
MKKSSCCTTLTALVVCIVCQSCLGWGDMFAERKTIVGRYTLVEDETGDFTLCYAYSAGDYIGRVNEKVLAYAIKDSFLVVKTMRYDKTEYYYPLNMNKDSTFAEAKNVIIDTIKSDDFEQSWLNTLSLQFIKVDN